jgi:hypothetical protein
MGSLRWSDEHGIIASFFIKLLLFLAITGVFAADGASILFANLKASDAASAGATACAASFKRFQTQEQATRAAVDAASQKGEGVQITAVAINPETQECSVSTRTTATTLVVGKIGFLKKYADATSTEVGTPPRV